MPGHDLLQTASHLRKRQHFVRQTRGGHAPRHAPDDGTRFILNQNASPPAGQRPAGLGAVRSHPREDHGQDVSAVGLGHASEEDIDGRPAKVFLGTVVQVEKWKAALHPDFHMPPPGRQIDRARQDRHAIDSLFKTNPAREMAEPLREHFREDRRHVLHDHHGHGKRLAQGAEKVGEHKTSMLQDLEAGRPLEIEPVVGAVLELGERLGVDMPHARTVYACAKLLASGTGQ